MIDPLHPVYNLESVAIQSAAVFEESPSFLIQQMTYPFQVVEFDQKEFYELINYFVFLPINSILMHSGTSLTLDVPSMIDRFSFWPLLQDLSNQLKRIATSPLN